MGGLLQAQELNTLTEDEQRHGWELLFDGSLEGGRGLRELWVDYKQDNPNTATLSTQWQVSTIPGEEYMFLTGTAGDIRSVERYGDFVLKFDYKVNGNQGFLYRTTLCGASPWESAVELAFDASYPSPEHGPGDAYDLYASRVQNFKAFDAPDPWNQIVVVAVEDSVEHWQNGEFLLGFSYWSEDFVRAYEDSKWPGYDCFCRPYADGGIQNSGYVEKGYFAIQSNHDGDLYLRNFKVLPDPVLGCTSPLAANYSPAATVDNGRCAGIDSPGDRIGTAASPAPLEIRDGAPPRQSGRVTSGQSSIRVSTKAKEFHEVTVRDVRGWTLEVERGRGVRDYAFEGLEGGLYFVAIHTPDGIEGRRVLVY